MEPMRVIWDNSLNKNEGIDKQGSVTARKIRRGREERRLQDGGVIRASTGAYLHIKGLCKSPGKTEHCAKYF